MANPKIIPTPLFTGDNFNKNYGLAAGISGDSSTIVIESSFLVANTRIGKYKYGTYSDIPPAKTYATYRNGGDQSINRGIAYNGNLIAFVCSGSVDFQTDTRCYYEANNNILTDRTVPGFTGDKIFNPIFSYDGNYYTSTGTPDGSDTIIDTGLFSSYIEGQGRTLFKTNRGVSFVGSGSSPFYYGYDNNSGSMLIFGPSIVNQPFAYDPQVPAIEILPPNGYSSIVPIKVSYSGEIILLQGFNIAKNNYRYGYLNIATNNFTMFEDDYYASYRQISDMSPNGLYFVGNANGGNKPFFYSERTGFIELDVFSGSDITNSNGNVYGISDSAVAVGYCTYQQLSTGINFTYPVYFSALPQREKRLVPIPQPIKIPCYTRCITVGGIITKV